MQQDVTTPPIYVVTFASQVNAKGLSHGQKLSMCGYLHKYSERPGSWLAGLLNKEWNMRFFCLYGSTLQYYLTEQDMLGHPRGHIDLQVRCVGLRQSFVVSFEMDIDTQAPPLDI